MPLFNDENNINDENNDFNIDDVSVITIENNPYYILPSGTTIYHGSNISFLNDQPTFFGFTYKTAKKYGIVKTYKTNRELKLIALMELNKENAFFKNADIESKKKIKAIFGTGEKEKYRYSKPDSDRKMMKYLCDTNIHKNKIWDGYAMNSKYYGDEYAEEGFHAELVLCDPNNNVTLINIEDENNNIGYNLSDNFSTPVKQPGRDYSYDPFATPGGGFKKKSRKSKKQKKTKKNRKNRSRKGASGNNQSLPVATSIQTTEGIPIVSVVESHPDNIRYDDPDDDRNDMHYERERLPRWHHMDIFNPIVYHPDVGEDVRYNDLTPSQQSEALTRINGRPVQIPESNTAGEGANAVTVTANSDHNTICAWGAQVPFIQRSIELAPSDDDSDEDRDSLRSQGGRKIRKKNKKRKTKKTKKNKKTKKTKKKQNK